MEQPYFIYELRLTPKYRISANWTDQTRTIISNHFNYLKSHCEQGKLLLAGRTDLDIEHIDNHGIAVFQAESIEVARDFMNNDPAVANGVMKANLYPFSMALLNTNAGDAGNTPKA